DVADLLRIDARIFNCPSDHADHTALCLVRGGHMVSVGGRAVTDDLGINMRAAPAGVFQFFENYDSRAFTDHKPVAVAVERARGTFGLIVACGERAHRHETRDAHRRDG